MYRFFVQEISENIKQTTGTPLNDMQIYLLAKTSEEKQITPQEIATEGMLMISNILFSLTGLEKRRYIEGDIPINGIESETRIFLSKEGEKIIDELQKASQKIMKKIGPDKIASLINNMEALKI